MKTLISQIIATNNNLPYEHEVVLNKCTDKFFLVKLWVD